MKKSPSEILNINPSEILSMKSYAVCAYALEGCKTSDDLAKRGIVVYW